MNKVWKIWSRATAAVVVSMCVSLGFAGSGHADFAVDSKRYCSAGWLPSFNGDTTPGSWLSVYDVTLKNPQQKASDCYGAFTTQNSGVQTQTNVVNAIFGAASGPDKFVFLDKHESGKPSSPGDPDGLGGIVFTLQTTGGKDGAPGTWTISWQDGNGASPANTPLVADLVVLLKGGNGNAAYLLSDVLLSTVSASLTGLFNIQFFNNHTCYKRDEHYAYSDGNTNKKKNDKKKKDKKKKDKKKKHFCKPTQPSLSHISLFGRVVPALEVPEPATIGMFGAGLIGLLAFRRRWSAGNAL